MATYGENDWRNYSEDSLEHSWGKKPEQKQREREYNHEYWEAHKDEILARRKRSQNRNTDSDRKIFEANDRHYAQADAATNRRLRAAGANWQVETPHDVNWERRNFGDYGSMYAGREANRHRQDRAERLEQLGNQREIRALKDQNAANYRQSQIDAEVSAHKTANARRAAASQAVAKRGYQSEGYSGNDSGTGNASAGASSGRYAGASAVRSQVVKPGAANASSSAQTSNIGSKSTKGANYMAKKLSTKTNQIAQRAVQVGQKAIDKVLKLQQNKR